MPDALDAASQRELVRRVVKGLPDETALVLLGNSAGLAHGVPHVLRTKDLDVSLVLLAEGRAIAPIDTIRRVLAALGVEPITAPDDQSWIQAHIDVDGSTRQVDFIRGKSRDRPNGTFIDRATLSRIVAEAEQQGQVLLPGLTDLIVTKAWAAVDQARHLRQGPEDPTKHQVRLAAYRQDARRFTARAIERGTLDANRFLALLDGMAEHRRKEVRPELVDAGALES